MRSWRPSKGDVVLYVALLSVILPGGTFLTRDLTPDGVSVWATVVVAVVAGGLFCRFLGSLIPAKLTAGGPYERAMFWMMPYLCGEWSLGMWHPGFRPYLGPGGAAGFTAATAFRCVRRWQATRATPKQERDAPLPPDAVYSRFSLVVSTITDLGGSISLAALVLIMGAQVSTALNPVLERAVAPFPGGHLTVAGHPVVASVAVSLCALVFAATVTSGFLRAITVGLRDLKLPRVGQYFWACLPYVIALAWSVRQPGLAFGCASALVLLIALGIWTDSPPDVAFSKAKAATLLWRSHLRQRLWSRGHSTHRPVDRV